MKLAEYRRIVVLTGAGISQAAGLPTYRGPGGLWTDPKLAQLTDAAALEMRRPEVCAMFWQFRQSIRQVEPTAAHRALAAFEARLPEDASFLLITQNVDGLHQRAGSQQVCEFHGTLLRWYCEVCGEELDPPHGDAPVHCGLLMRPAAVLFGEMIPPDAVDQASAALEECDLFVAIGTSGTVSPASGFVEWAQENGARSILLNLEIDDAARLAYTECHAGTADALVTRWFG